MESSLPAGFRPKKISLNVGGLIKQVLGLQDFSKGSASDVTGTGWQSNTAVCCTRAATADWLHGSAIPFSKSEGQTTQPKAEKVPRSEAAAAEHLCLLFCPLSGHSLMLLVHAFHSGNLHAI